MDITRHGKQNDLRIGFLRLKIRICKKHKALLASFDGNACIVGL